jgi:hypothetical protein
MVMPSKSKKQQNFMAAVANNPKFAKKAGVPQSVGKDYEKADKMKGMKKYQARWHVYERCSHEQDGQARLQ